MRETRLVVWPVQQEPFQFTVGDIGVGGTWAVTPHGALPMWGTTWYVEDVVTYESYTPMWAVLCAAIGFFILCFLSLFFLMAKDQRMTGFVKVTCVNGAARHVTHVPISDSTQCAAIHELVARAQHLSSIAPRV